MTRAATVVVALSLASMGLANADPRPGYRLSRQDEDWSALRNPALRSDTLDSLKFIALNATGSAWLSVGGDLRERYEHFNDNDWGNSAADGDGYLLHRIHFHLDAHLADSVRVYAQFKNDLETGRDGGPRPVDRDAFDVHQLFVDFAPAVAGVDGPLLRVGRQEITFGSQRLVSVRESPNVRRSFDGARTTWYTHGWRFDGLFAWPVEIRPDTFDDVPDADQKFWGAYGTGPMPGLSALHADIYYLGLWHDAAEFLEGTARERRHSIGTRLWGDAAHWDWNFEFVFQFGEFGAGDIRAWTAASDTGYTLQNQAWQPRVGLKADVTSGDHDPGDGDLETFNPLFPKGAYFGEANLIGPQNHIDLHPSIETHPFETLTLLLDSVWFWRESTDDAVYNGSLRVVRPGTASDARYIGMQAGVGVEWKVQRHCTWTARYEHFFPGRFLAENPPNLDVDYVSTWINYQF